MVKYLIPAFYIALCSLIAFASTKSYSLEKCQQGAVEFFVGGTINKESSVCKSKVSVPQRKNLEYSKTRDSSSKNVVGMAVEYSENKVERRLILEKELQNELLKLKQLEETIAEHESVSEQQEENYLQNRRRYEGNIAALRAEIKRLP